MSRIKFLMMLLFLVIAVAIAPAAFTDSATPANISLTPTTKDLASATKELAIRFDSLAEEIAKAPAHIDTSHWDNLEQASAELLATVKKLRAAREAILASVKGIGGVIGDFRAEIGKVRQQYLDLEQAARGQIDGTDGSPTLTESLLEKTRGEADIYASAAASCDAMAERFSKQQLGIREQLIFIDRSGAMLVRLEKAAELYGQLAKLGGDAEKMNRDMSAYAEQLNALLKTFAQLDAQTKEVITGLIPNAAPKTETLPPPKTASSFEFPSISAERRALEIPLIRRPINLSGLDDIDRQMLANKRGY